MSKIKTVFVAGPTASGKTELAIKLAKRFDGEIISADSMQIYKGIHIASAAPDTVEMRHENDVRTCVHQVKRSHMRNLCGKARTFGGDGCERRLLERGSASVVGHDDAETKLCKQRPPKRRALYL